MRRRKPSCGPWPRSNASMEKGRAAHADSFFAMGRSPVRRLSRLGYGVCRGPRDLGDASFYIGHKMIRQKRRFLRPLYPEMAALYTAGLSCDAIAQRLNCATTSVRHGLKQLKTPMRARGGARRNQFQSPILARAFSLVKNGASYGQAATRLGLTRSAVSGACYRAKKWGISA